MLSAVVLIDSVAQLVEQLTLNQWVVGSSPTGVTSRVMLETDSGLGFILIRYLFFLCILHISLRPTY